MKRNVIIYAAGWVGLVILAILNGTIRVAVYGPFMSDLSAHQVSTAIGLSLFGIYIWIFTGIFRIASSKQAIIIGVMWLSMTIIFEFLFGHYVIGHSWAKLLEDYNVLKGRVWLLVLIWTTVAPYLFYRIRSWQGSVPD
jgi:hypothetical protein